MKRAIEKQLIDWKNDKNQMPIILRGARQTGKSFLVEQFGEKNFENIVTINLEFQPEFKSCFETMDPLEINNLISAMTGKKIIPGKTLFFIDEIQECPQAILALRYYKEKMPKQHVISAGSLLEFVLNDEDFQMPVGRIQYLYLKPFSFKEFLQASNKLSLLEIIEQSTIQTKIPAVIHEELLKLVRQFFVLGGMPAVLSEYFSSQDLSNCQNIQSSLLNTYQNDFGKYSRKTNHKYLQQLFSKAPGLIGQQFKYVNVSSEMRSRDIKVALENLQHAGIVFSVYATHASGLPFNALANEKRFKLLFLDVGLVKRATNLDAKILLSEDLILLNQGAIAEQFVGQELMAYMNPYEAPQLFYWTRESKSSLAEVDYVINVDSTIIPIEVKAGKTGRLKSLRQFMNEKNSKIGVRISQKPLEIDNKIFSIPLYMISELSRLIKEVV